MKIFSNRFRALMLPLTLVLGMVAASTRPAAAMELLCEEQCWAWDIHNGCTASYTCCVATNTGMYACWPNN